MTTWHGRMLAAAGWLWVFAANAAAAPPSPAELRAWLAGLDAEAYAAREEASRRLIDAGEAAIDFLAEGVNSESPEAAWRASVALTEIAAGGEAATLSRVSAALSRLSHGGRPGLIKLAQELHSRQAKLRHDRAVAKIQSFGGRFGGEDGEWLAAGGVFGGMPAVVEVIGDVVAEKVAEDIKVLVEAGDPVPEKPALEIPAELKAFDEALKAAEIAIAKPAEPVAKGPAPSPPAEAPVPPPAPPPVTEDPPADIAPPPALPAIDLAFGDIFIGDAVGIDLGGAEALGGMLALDSNWRGGDDGLAVLRDLPEIASLSISSAQLTDAALAHVAALPRLTQLELHGKMFTAAALHKFRAQRPATRIFARGDALLGVNADMEGPCVLSSVYYGSGAYEAGLAQGDEVVKVDGHKVADFSDLTIAVFTHAPGEKLQVEFKRDGRLKTVTVLLKDRRTVESGSR